MTRKTEHNVAVVVGRWQLPHIGHDTLFQEAFRVADRVIVVIGSAFRSRDTRQPFSADERMDMLLATFTQEQRDRVVFLPVRDYYNDERWDRAVAAGVQRLTEHSDRIALVGYKKDHTTYYLERFPSWRTVQVEPTTDIDATSLRNMFFGATDLGATFSVLSRHMKPGALEYLRAWSHLPQYEALKREHAAVLQARKDYPQTWSMAADALVRIADHVLLVQRGGAIGHDLWAVPGGFVEPHELFLPAALRELREETHFPLPDARMRQALKEVETFGHPLRSPRGRIVSQAHYFAFGDGNLPEVRPGDDAKAAKWFHISELPSLEDKLFEDHGPMLDRFVGLFPKD